MTIFKGRALALAAATALALSASGVSAAVDNSQLPTPAICSGSCGVGSAIGFSRTVPEIAGDPTGTSFSDEWTLTLSEAGTINGILFSNNTLSTFQLFNLNVALEDDGTGTNVSPVGGYMVPNPPPFNSVLQVAVNFADLAAGSYRFVVTGTVPEGQAAGQYQFQGGVVSQVPLPAAGWLLLTALMGLVACLRIRREETHTA
jgi:hypothetical protein